MVHAKAELFDENLRECTKFFKALSHPARLQIIKLLAENRSCIPGEILDELPLSRTTVSQHLTELKKAGLITCYLHGVKVHYCLNCDRLEKVKIAFTDFFDNINCNDCSL